MAQTLLELAAAIVSAHASVTELTTEELLLEIQKVHTTLQKLEFFAPEDVVAREEARLPLISLKKAFQSDQVFCMICGKGGMKTLARHLAQSHNIKPADYRKKFNIPKNQPLTARNFSESRRKMAQERGLAENLAKARATKAAKISAVKSNPARSVGTKIKTGTL
jgi:predicted transcriptional regulator